ncbi:MAG: hypothetical protein IPI10_18270 [Bacteroidetes bacterium]|nr:hypothetical protein [Bacteroidota bacterium]
MSTDTKLHINLSGTGYELNCAMVQKENEYTAIQLAKTFLEEAEEKQAKQNLNEAQYFEGLKTYRGANLFEPGQIEFWKDRKRLKTYKFQEIVQSAVLFPILNIVEMKFSSSDESKKAIAFGYQEKGHLAKYTIQAKQFLMDELQFHVIEIPMSSGKMKVLYKVVYKGKELKSLKEDTLVTGAVLRVV